MRDIKMYSKGTCHSIIDIVSVCGKLCSIFELQLTPPTPPEPCCLPELWPFLHAHHCSRMSGMVLKKFLIGVQQKSMWPVAACIRVASSFVLIHLIIFLCCVMGTTKNALAFPHCGIALHDCCHLSSDIIFFP